MTFSLTPGTTAVTLLFAIGAFGVMRFMQARKNPMPKKVNWTPSESVSITVAIYYITQIMVALIIGAIVALYGLDQEQVSKQINDSPFLQFSFIAAVEALTVWFLVVFLKRRKTPWKAIGWVRPKLADVGYALGAFGVYFVVYGILVTTLVEKYLPIDTEQRQELGFSTTVVGPELVFVLLSLVILPPIIEEIVVRGFLFTGLKTKMSLIPAAVITSIIFAAAHLQWGGEAPLLWTAAIDTFVLSMILVYLRHKTGSLWPGIGLHFIKNGIAFLVLFVFKIY